MIELFFITGIGLWLLGLKDPKVNNTKIPSLLADKIDKYWEVAQKAIADQHFLRAEKALLNILKIDQKNAAAYNRLGILYTKERNFSEAVECFEIAQSLEPTANNLHNVGLIYYNLQEYSKSVLAFEQALEIDDTLASRYIAYAKALEKNHQLSKSIEALEKAISIEENPQTLKMLALAYHSQGKDDLAKSLYLKAKTLINNQIKLTAHAETKNTKIIK